MLYWRLDSCIIHVKLKECFLLHAASHMPQLLLKWALLQLTSCHTHFAGILDQSTWLQGCYRLLHLGQLDLDTRAPI